MFGVSVFFNGAKGSSGGGGGGGSPPSIGYNNSATHTGNYGNYTIPSGSPAAGTLIFVVVSDTTSSGVPLITGGAAWTTATGSTTGRGLFYKIAGASEPSSYNIYYPGGSKNDSSGAGIVWVSNGSTLDDIQYASSTATSPSATSTSSLALGIVFAAGASSSDPSKPSGYTAWITSHTATSSPIDIGCGAKGSVGTGTISPGAWGASQTRLWTALVKA